MMACAIQVRHGGGFSSCKKIFSEVKGENKIPKARDGDVSASEGRDVDESRISVVVPLRRNCLFKKRLLVQFELKGKKEKKR